jgi:antirestriction protein ArdC
VAKTQDEIYEEVNDALKAALEAGTVPWHQPWASAMGAAGGFPMRMSNNRPYRGVNIWLLGFKAMAMGYESPWWGTYGQIAKLAGMVEEPMMRGGKPVLYKYGKIKGQPRMHWVSPDGTPRGVREGEKSTTVTLNRRFTYEDKNDLDENGKPRRKVGYSMRTFPVFNAEQASALPARYYPAAPEVAEPSEPQPHHAEADQLIKEYVTREGITWTNANPGRAYYQWLTDVINTPPASAYESMAERYSTEFHEIVHSTGHPDRLARIGPGDKEYEDGAEHSNPYAAEELVAEMGNAMLMATLGITGAFDNSAAYIAGWLRRLRDDNRLVVRAAGRAQRAADFVQGITFGDDDSESEDQ